MALKYRDIKSYELTFAILLLAMCLPGSEAETLADRCKNIEFEVLADPDDSQNFIVCLYGTPERRSCAQGECFNAKIKMCTTDTKECTPQAPVDNAAATTYCKNNQLQNEAIPSMSCSHFYFCLGDIEPVYMACPNNMHFSAYERRCLSPPLARCQTQAKLCESKEEDRNVTYAGEKCSEFYECEGDQLTRKRCDYATKYDANAGKCVADAQLTCVNDTLPECADPKNNNQYFPHRSCAKFYACSNGNLFIGQCSNGYRFDKNGKYCTEDRAGLCDN